MNIYIGLGGYGCNCIAETNIDDNDLRVLIDSDEMTLNSAHTENNNESTFRILYKQSRSKFDDLNKRMNYVYSDTEGVSNELAKILSAVDHSQSDSINIKLFSTMCGNFGSKHILKIANYISIYAHKHFKNYKIIIVLIPEINIDSLSTVLNNNICDFIKESNAKVKLFNDENTKAFVMTSDSNASFFHQSHRFITDVLEVLKNIHTEEYIGKKNYEKAVLWEFETCILLTLKNWLPKAIKRYSYINQELAINDSKQIERINPLQNNKNIRYIFISYAHADSARVLPIIQKMQEEGYNVWYDDGIDPGTEWDENIAGHVENCTYFIAMLSTNYLQSDNCKDELNYARDLNKKRLLIYIEDCQLPGGMAMRLNRLQSIFEFKYPVKDEFYKKLFSAKDIESCKASVLKTKANQQYYVYSSDIVKVEIFKQQLMEQSSGAIESLTTSEFVDSFLEALTKKEHKSFVDYYKNIELFILDDFQFIGGKETTQETLYDIIKYRFSHNLCTCIITNRVGVFSRSLENMLNAMQPITL